MSTKTISPNGVSSVEQIFARVEERFAPEKFEIPDYEGTFVEVQMLNAGEIEHCDGFARMADGTRNWDAFIRIFTAYALAAPKLATDKDPRVEAEKVAAILERFPRDWFEPIYNKAMEMTGAYNVRRQQREQEGRNTLPFFPKRASAPASSGTDSTSSPPKS
jgi:hypothetical protein